jgi:hypothetical protein
MQEKCNINLQLIPHTTLYRNKRQAIVRIDREMAAWILTDDPWAARCVKNHKIVDVMLCGVKDGE